MNGLYREEKYNVVKFGEYKHLIKKKLWDGQYPSLTRQILSNLELKQ